MGKKVEAVKDFIFLGSKITADSDCSHVIKRHLLLGRKAMTNLDSILKSRDISLPTKVKVKSLSRVRLLAAPWTTAQQALHPWDFPGKNTGVGRHCLLR